MYLQEEQINLRAIYFENWKEAQQQAELTHHRLPLLLQTTAFSEDKKENSLYENITALPLVHICNAKTKPSGVQ